ncbi:hypothetical protein [Arthrobacter burdickii]
MTAAFEIQAQPGNLVAMTQFRTASRVLALDLAADITVKGLTMAEQKKLSMIMSFLEGIFSQANPTNNGSRYIAPDLIAKEIFNPFPDLFTGWRYKAIADTRGLPWTVNLALKSVPAKDLLEHVRTDIVEIDPNDGINGRHRIIVSLILAPNRVDLVSPDAGN